MGEYGTHIFDTAFDVALSWCLDVQGSDVFELDSIAYGQVAQIDIFLLVKDVLERDKAGSRFHLSFDSLIESVKKRHLEWQIKERASRMLRSVLRPSPIECGAKAIFIYDVWNLGSIRSLSDVQTSLPDKCTALALTFEPRTFRLVSSLTGAKAVLYPDHFSGIDAGSSRITRDHWLFRYREHRSTLLDKLRAICPTLAETILAKIDAFVKPFFSQLARDRERAMWFIDYVKPESMAMATDCHKWSRLLTLLARPQGIRTLVIQHGAPVARHAYVPVTADTMAVWGKASAERLISWGAPAEKLVITGQPRFDSIPRLRKNRAANLTAKRNPKIVVAASPLTDALDVSFMRIVCEGLKGIEQELDLTLKLHPGESKEQFFRRLTVGDTRVWQIERYCDTHKLIASADAVITTQSTVGIETLALGTSLIIVDLPGIPAAIPYGETGAAFVVRSAVELREAVTEIISEGAAVSQRRMAGDRLAEEYLFKLDGHATDRVVELISHGRMEKHRHDD